MSPIVDIAITILEKAVLDVIPKNKGIITTSAISKKAGIYRKHGAGGLNDAITQGILNKLHEEKYVDKVPGGWVLK